MEAPPPASGNSSANGGKPPRRIILDLVLTGMLAATLGGSCGAWHWMLDLCSHFRWYYFAMASIWIVAIARSRRQISKCALGLIVVWNGVLLLPYYIPVTEAPVSDSAATLSIISINVHTANQNKAAVVDYLRDRKPDLVIVMEVDLKWTESLHLLADLYPHRFIEPRPDNFGIGLLSKLPLSESKFVEFGGAEVPTVVATIEHGGHRFQLIGTHPLPPVGAERANERNLQLRKLGDFVSQSSLPTILAGDLNATPWSCAFRDVIARSGLRDSAVGRGIHGTWNADSWVRIPIDHVLIPPDVTVVKRSVGPDVGSDHFPVEVTIAFP